MQSVPCVKSQMHTSYSESVKTKGLSMLNYAGQQGSRVKSTFLPYQQVSYILFYIQTSLF